MYLILVLSSENELKGLDTRGRRMELTNIVIHIIIRKDSVQTDLAVTIISAPGDKRKRYKRVDSHTISHVASVLSMIMTKSDYTQISLAVMARLESNYRNDCYG